MLARGELQTVGATTLDEYRKHIEKDAALERRFQPVKVEEPTLSHTIEILKGVRDQYETHHRVTITDQAIVAAANLADRYISDRHLPDKAIDLMDEACAHVRVELDSKPAELDKVARHVLQLQVEEAALASEQEWSLLSGATHNPRLETVRHELAEARQRQSALEDRYQESKALLEQLATLKRNETCRRE